MTSTREERISDAILKMRDPLARVSLAASQLSREVLTPTARNLASGISEAASRIDEGIENALRNLRRDGADSSEPQDCRTVLDSIRDRLAPVLQAYSVRWDVDEGRAETPVLADRDATEQGALALLRAGIALAGESGRVSLSFASQDESAGQGLVLEVDPGAKPRAEIDEVLCGPRCLALRLGGSFQSERSGDTVRAVLRLGNSGLA